MYELSARCNACGEVIMKEDAVYDDRTSAHYCDLYCFHEWVDDNYVDVVRWYKKLHVT